jgi:hypothetical protein
MGLITRILFGKKKAKPIETKPIETKPIETKIINFSLNGFDFCDTKIIQKDYYYAIINKILDLIKSGFFTISSEKIIYENEKFCILYYLDEYKRNILYINKKEEPSIRISYNLTGKCDHHEKLFSIAISERLEKEKIIRKEKLNAQRKEAEQSILKHL